MNILFFNPNFDPSSLTYARMNSMPIGLISIATYLNRHGHKAVIVDRAYDFNDFDTLTETYRPDIVGIALMSNMTIHDMIAISDHYRAAGIPVIIGGTYASMVPEIVLNEGKADYITIGEGEQIWLNLADAYADGRDPRTVNGLAYRDASGEIVFTPPQDFMDLSLLGPSDFSLVPDASAYFQTAYCYKNMAYLYLSKGCTGSCTFCYNQNFHHCCRRTRPAEHLLDEVEYLMKHHGLETVYFSDELWGAGKRDREEFYAAMEARGLSFIWGCQTRIGVLKKEDIQEMFDHGCRWIMFGIEAPPGHLAQIANKKIPYQMVPGTLEACKEVGMISNISFIMNYPHETEQDLRDTVTYAQSLVPTFCSMHIFSPFQKSVLYEQVVREGLYDPPKTLEDLRKFAITETVLSSFSEVPDRDYKVIRACFLFQDLFARLPEASQGSSMTKESIQSVFLNIRSQKFGEWLRGAYYTGKYFLQTSYYAFCFPRIRKKYGFRFKFVR